VNDEGRKLLRKLLQEEIKPVHGEIARFTSELRDLKAYTMRTNSKGNDQGREIARMSSDVIDLQNQVGGVHDDFKGVKQSNDEIRKHVGLLILAID